MNAQQYWRGILKERDDLNRAPSADITLRQADIKALVDTAFAAGQRDAKTSAPPPEPPPPEEPSVFDELFGKSNPFRKK